MHFLCLSEEKVKSCESGVGEGGNADFGAWDFQEDIGASFEGGTGRHNIIDQKDMMAF